MTRTVCKEWPPNSKKLSWSPTCFTPRTSPQIFARATSCRRPRRHEFRRCSGRSGCGSAFRSTLPLGVKGNRSRVTKAEGTMYSGSFACSRPRNSESSAALHPWPSNRPPAACRREHPPARPPPPPALPAAPPTPIRFPPTQSESPESSPGGPAVPDTRWPRRAGSAPGRLSCRAAPPAPSRNGSGMNFSAVNSGRL